MDMEKVGGGVGGFMNYIKHELEKKKNRKHGVGDGFCLAKRII